MYEFLKKHGQTLAFGIGVLICAIFMVMIFGGDGDLSADSDDQLKYDSTRYSFGIAAAIGLAIVCAIGALVFGVLQTIDNPKGSLKGLIGFGLVAVLAIIGYSMASGVPADDHATLEAAVNKFQDAQDSAISASKYKWIGYIMCRWKWSAFTRITFASINGYSRSR